LACSRILRDLTLVDTRLEGDTLRTALSLIGTGVHRFEVFC